MFERTDIFRIYRAYAIQQRIDLAEDGHGVADADTAEGTDNIAHESHENANGNEGAGVGGSQNGGGSGTADVGEGSNAAGEEVKLEELGGTMPYPARAAP